MVSDIGRVVRSRHAPELLYSSLPFRFLVDLLLNVRNRLYGCHDIWIGAMVGTSGIGSCDPQDGSKTFEGLVFFIQETVVHGPECIPRFGQFGVVVSASRFFLESQGFPKALFGNLQLSQLDMDGGNVMP